MHYTDQTLNFFQQNDRMKLVILNKLEQTRLIINEIAIESTAD